MEERTYAEVKRTWSEYTQNGKAYGALGQQNLLITIGVYGGELLAEIERLRAELAEKEAAHA